MFELLEEAAPRAARRFAERIDATEGDCDGVSYRDSCEMTSIDDELRVSFGAGKGVKTTIEVEGDLTHAAAGVVGMDLKSGEFCVTTAACESLDESAQVVGRVISGLEILRALTHREKGAKVPMPVRVTACGVVRGGADVSALVGVAARGRAEAAAKAREAAERIRNESQHDTLKRLRAESAQKGAEMNEIVRSTLGKKLKEAPSRRSRARACSTPCSVRLRATQRIDRVNCDTIKTSVYQYHSNRLFLGRVEPGSARPGYNSSVAFFFTPLFFISSRDDAPRLGVFGARCAGFGL